MSKKKRAGTCMTLYMYGSHGSIKKNIQNESEKGNLLSINCVSREGVVKMYASWNYGIT